MPVSNVLEELEKPRTVPAYSGVDLAGAMPTIVMIGDQGSGKSSLLSALTGLQLPVGRGAVTRAAIKIFIRPGTEHKAVVQYPVCLPDNLIHIRWDCKPGTPCRWHLCTEQHILDCVCLVLSRGPASSYPS